VIQIALNMSWSPVVNLGLSVVYLLVLYGEDANRYFEQTNTSPR